MRPSSPLVTTASLTATNRFPSASMSRVASSTTSSSPARTRATPSSSSSRGIALRNPTRPKFTPITGIPVPRNRCSARSIVPSPPSTIATSTSSGVTCVSPAMRTSSTLSALATDSSRASPEPSASRRPWSTTAARLTRLADGIVDPAVELISVCRLRTVDQVNEELPVSLWPGETGVYDPCDLRAPLC